MAPITLTFTDASTFDVCFDSPIETSSLCVFWDEVNNFWTTAGVSVDKEHS